MHPLKNLPTVRLLLYTTMGCIALVGCTQESQIDFQTFTESTYTQRIDSIWQIVRTHFEAQDYEAGREVQATFAPEFLAYYQLHPTTAAGHHAITSAFIMWGNLGEVKPIEAALPSIDRSSSVWASLINSIRSAYLSAGQTSAFVDLLRDLASTLADPDSRAEALMHLGEYHRERGQLDKASTYYAELVTLPADSFYVEVARGHLYELNSLSAGNVAPSFQAIDLQGQPISLGDWAGRVVLLDFWATWCAPCIPELPYLRSLRNEYKTEDFVLVSFSLDERRADLEAFLNNEPLPWIHSYVAEKWDAPLARLYNVTSLPRNYLLNRNGMIVGKDLRGADLAEAVAAAILMP